MSVISKKKGLHVRVVLGVKDGVTRDASSEDLGKRCLKFMSHQMVYATNRSLA
jgi:hypothetical protein